MFGLWAESFRALGNVDVKIPVLKCFECGWACVCFMQHKLHNNEADAFQCTEYEWVSLYYIMSLHPLWRLAHTLSITHSIFLPTFVTLCLSPSLHPSRSLAQFYLYLFALFRSRPRTWCIRTNSKQFEVREYLHPLLIRLKAFRWLK